MLHWIAGRQPENPDATVTFDPPDTPAPVFAMRAFRHAIFGTPDTAPPKAARRNSNAEGSRPRQYDARPVRPNMPRPKSAGDAYGLFRDDEPALPDPVSSPTKGILLTPGTAAAKRKTVSFGDGVVDNEDKRPIKSGLPDDCPGKFPSPLGKFDVDDESADEPVVEKGRGRTKLTEQLEKVRDESAKRKRKHRHGRDELEENAPREFADPHSESGKYWKAQYESYRENSQREMKKLITKHKAAKGFARDKDFQCTELADELRQERKKVERLEKKTAELEAQLKEMQAGLHDDAKKPRLETVRSQPSLIGSRIDPKPATGDIPGAPAAAAAQQPQQAAIQVNSKTPNYLRDQGETALDAHQTKLNDAGQRPHSRPRLDNLRTRTNDDIWAVPPTSSALAPSKREEKAPASPKSGRAVTSGTDLTPLQTISINTLSSEALARRDSAQPSPRPDPKFEALPLLSPSLPAQPPSLSEPRLSPHMLEKAPTSSDEGAPPRLANDPPKPPPSIPAAQASSPFHPDPMRSPPAPAFTKRDSARPLRPAPEEPGNTKENVSPSTPKPVGEKAGETATAAAGAGAVKPSAVWTAINAPGVGKRSTSIVDREGREVERGRVEAARARIAARGRVVS